MASLVLLGIIFALFLYKVYKWVVFKPEGFPPGPPRVPFIGSYWAMLLLNKKELHKAALTLGNFYKTKILGLWLGDFPTVVINDYELIRESFRRTEFDGKPKVYVAQMRDPKEEAVHGIFFEEGELWKNQRWFMLRYLRDFGFGRRHDDLEVHIQEEIRGFIEMLREGPKFEHEKPFVTGPGFANVPLIFSPSMVNCFFQVILGERMTREEQTDMFNVARASITFQRTGDSYGKMLSVIPWVRHIFPQESDYNTLRRVSIKLHDFISRLIDKQIATYDPNHERHFLDMYIKQLKEAEAVDDKTKGFFYDQFIFSLMDFFIPAFTGIAAQVALLLQVAIEKPDVAQKMHKEIESVVGLGRLPTLDDRINMPYTEACIRESMRYDTPLPSGLPHKVLEDTTLGGYKLQKDTLVVYSHYAMNTDKKIWGDPENFRPERFISKTGKLDLQKDITLPFGAGKRLCAGETFARNLNFLYVASVFQNFKPTLPEGVNIKTLVEQNGTGLLRTTPDFWVKLEPY